jgi:outer membrane protein assembly factor BamE
MKFAMRLNLKISKNLFCSLPALALVLLSACVYRMPIQQGNFLDPTQVSQLEVGMTRSQVSFLLGTPMVPNGFNSDRWDYYYYAKHSRMKTPFTNKLTVYFKDEKVERIEKKAQEPAATAVPATAN